MRWRPGARRCVAHGHCPFGRGGEGAPRLLATAPRCSTSTRRHPGCPPALTPGVRPAQVSCTGRDLRRRTRAARLRADRLRSASGRAGSAPCPLVSCSRPALCHPRAVPTRPYSSWPRTGLLVVPSSLSDELTARLSGGRRGGEGPRGPWRVLLERTVGFGALRPPPHSCTRCAG